MLVTKNIVDAKQLIDTLPKTEELFDYPIDWLMYDKVIKNILCPLLTVLLLEITIVSFSRGLTSLELCLFSASLTGMFLAVPRLVYHQLNFAATFLSGRGDLSLSFFIGVLF